MTKSILHIVTLLVFATAFSQELTQIEDFGENPGNLKMFLYNPTPNDSVAKPVVFALHGCGQTAKSFNELTDWTKLAHENNFIVVFPQQKFGNNATGCFNWFKEKDFSKAKGENESIIKMLHFIQKNYPIDKQKVFITGVSAGAAMSVALAYTHPEIFAGVCSYAGGAYGLATNGFQTFKLMNGKQKFSDSELVKINYSNSISVPKLIVFHGKKDNTVTYKNSELLIRQWCTTFKIDYQNSKETSNYNDNSKLTKTDYFTENTSKIIFYSIEGLGHQYLVNPDGENANKGGKLNYLSKDYDFFATYQIAKDFGLIKND